MLDVNSVNKLQKRWSMCFGSVELLRTFGLVAERNTVVHDGKIQHPSGLTKRATDYIDEFKDSQVHLAIPVSVGAVQRWRPPSGSVYKVNFDASVFASTDSSGGPFGFRDVVVEGDNSAVMKAILSQRARWSRLGHLHEDISCLAAGFRCIKFECVRGSADNIAHMLARFAKSVDVENSVWLEEPPFPALEALSLDLNFLNE
uniref:RNase H type-1 domain-containing protein n=1 Tax=Quercus lobata TaxID=97700 RepID=A0A7N2LV66_QUELO